MDTLSEEIRERVIRIEERQQAIQVMLKDSLHSSAQLGARVSALEELRHKAVGMLAVAALVFSMAWEFIKNHTWGK